MAFSGGRPQPAKDLHYQVAPQEAGLSPIYQSIKTGPTTRNDGLPAKNGLNSPTSQPPGLKAIPNLEKTEHHHHHQDQKILTPPSPLPPPPPPTNGGPPSPEQLLMSNLFVMGLNKDGHHKQLIPEPQVVASRSRGLGVIPGLTAPVQVTPKASTNTASTGLRAPCDPLVDALFALDDMKNLWLARESIRYYETQLLPSSKASFGVVLCGQHKSFYTALHGHFSGECKV